MTAAERILRVVVADDEPLARQAVTRHLGEWGAAEVVAVCEDGPSAVESIRRLAPDVAVLDIQMPEMDGFGVLESLAHPPAVVFLTAYGEHAVRAFSVRAVDYLLKPLDPNRFYEAMDRARDAVLHRAAAGAPSPYLKRLQSRVGRRIRVILSEEIEWIEAADYYARVHTADGNGYLVRDSLSYLSVQLDPGVFVRVHRCAIVNVAAVRELCPSDAAVSLRSGASVPISREGRGRLLRALQRR